MGGGKGTISAEFPLFVPFYRRALQDEKMEKTYLTLDRACMAMTELDCAARGEMSG